MKENMRWVRREGWWCCGLFILKPLIPSMPSFFILSLIFHKLPLSTARCSLSGPLASLQTAPPFKDAPSSCPAIERRRNSNSKWPSPLTSSRDTKLVLCRCRDVLQLETTLAGQRSAPPTATWCSGPNQRSLMLVGRYEQETRTSQLWLYLFDQSIA